jgi:thioredoxin-related protein
MMAAFAFVSLTWGSLALAANAPLRLIMVEEAGCRFCMRWDADVGASYARSREGAVAPLLRVKRDAPELAAFAPVVYTPTFIVAEGGKEIGRITGYPGETFFWEELAALLEKAGISSEPAGRLEPASLGTAW